MSAAIREMRFICELFINCLHIQMECAKLICSLLRFIWEVIPVARHFGHAVRILHWCSDQTMTEALTQMDLTAAQGRIMGYIAHRKEPPCSRDIEEEFHLSHPTVSGILARLEKKGFIEFRADGKDRRFKRIFILAKGRECTETMHKTIQENEERLVRGFSEEEKVQFMSFLERAIGNMGVQPCHRRNKEETSE